MHIYEKFDSAFRRAGAYAIFNGSEYVGRVAFKRSRDGAGRLTAYVQFWGGPMQYATAGGGDYDKRTAAVEAAFRKMMPEVAAGQNNREWRETVQRAQAVMADRKRDGQRWRQRLEAAGFTVACVID